MRTQRSLTSKMTQPPSRELMMGTLANSPVVYNEEPKIETNKSIYEIGQWYLDANINKIIKDTTVVELEHRLTRLLIYFMDRPNKILRKEDILNDIWQRKVVNEDSLAVAVSKLRKALDDSPRNPRYIKTIQGIGYQFIAQEKRNETPSPGATVSRTPRFTHWIALALLAALLIVLSFYVALKNQTNSITSANNSIPTTLGSKAERNLFVQASLLMKRKQANELRQAIAIFHQIIELNKESAEAYLGVAEAKIQLLGATLSAQQNVTEVRALLEKSLSINPDLARAHMRLGYLLFYHYHHYMEAEKHFKLSLTLNPNDDEAHYQYEQFLLVQKRFPEAHKQIELARDVNPSSYPYTYLAWVYLLEGKYSEAANELDRISSTEMQDRYFHLTAQNIYYSLGDERKTFEHMEWFFKELNFSNEKKLAIENEFQRDGLTAVYKWLLVNKETADVGQYSPPLSWARFAASIGETELALQYLEEAYAAKQFRLVCATVDPRYDSLRNEPRFKALLNKLSASYII